MEIHSYSSEEFRRLRSGREYSEAVTFRTMQEAGLSGGIDKGKRPTLSRMMEKIVNASRRCIPVILWHRD